LNFFSSIFEFSWDTWEKAHLSEHLWGVAEEFIWEIFFIFFLFLNVPVDKIYLEAFGQFSVEDLPDKISVLSGYRFFSLISGFR
jgi:hypothetical protein